MNFKCQISNVKFQILIVITLFTFHFSLFTFSYAAEATPSSGPVEEASIKSKLDQLKAEIASKAAKIKQEVSKELQDRVFIGNIQSISTLSLDLMTKDGPKKITLNIDTAYENLNPKSKSLNFGGLKKEATIAALGDIDDMGNLVAKKIVLLPTSPAPAKTHLWGEIKAISKQTLTIEVKNSEKKVVLTDKDTDIQKNGLGALITAIEPGEKVIVSGMTKNDQLTASLIYVITSSSDPSPVPSPSPTPKTVSSISIPPDETTSWKTILHSSSQFHTFG